MWNKEELTVKKKKVLSQISKKLQDVTLLDWVVFGLISVFCFFTMSQNDDMAHTGASSFTLLRGHILDFYEFNATCLNGNNYMISTYIVYAIWNLPLALTGLMGPSSLIQTMGTMFWFKTLPVVVFLLSGKLIYSIFKPFEEEFQIKAKWVAYLFLLTPTAFYGLFMFSQYDVFTVFFMLLGLKFLLKRDDRNLVLFSLVFGFATTFKYHAALFFFPILLYSEKRIRVLIKNVLFFLLPIVLVNLPYIHSSFFDSGVGEFGALNYFFAAGVDYFIASTTSRIYLVPLIWAVICAFAYLQKKPKDIIEYVKYVSYYSGFVVWLAFGVVFWHPQWVTIATPFLVIAIVCEKKKDVLCFVDLIFAVAFLNFVECGWPGLTFSFYNHGVLKDFVKDRLVLAPISFSDFCFIKDGNLAFTILSALLLVRAIICKPRNDESVLEEQYNHIWYRIRSIVGICILVIPMIVSLISAITAPRFAVSLDRNPLIETVEINIVSEVELKDMTAGVWSDDGGQDDLVWYSFEYRGDNVWSAKIPLREHNTLGIYFVHIYGDVGNGMDFVTAVDFQVDSISDGGLDFLVADNTYIGPMANGNVYEQHFELSDCYITSIEYLTATYERVNDSEIIVELYKGNEILFSELVDASNMTDNAAEIIVFEQPLHCDEGDDYCLRFTAKGVEDDMSDCISMAQTRYGFGKYNYSVINGTRMDTNLALRINCL